MINGIEKFKSYFMGFQNQYVLIGGSACDIVLQNKGISFRSTVDLDVVLIVEALTPEFASLFFRFIREGGYENRNKSNGVPQFYRFDKPKDSTFPLMIELLSRVDGILLDKEQVCGPISISDKIYSLSAILLNNSYYQMLEEGRESIDGLSVLSELYLIPFKAKAWLDLSERKAKGEHVKSDDIKKHRKDVVRLALTIPPDARCLVNNEVYNDMHLFIAEYKKNPLEPIVLGYGEITGLDIIEVLERTYICPRNCAS